MENKDFLLDYKPVDVSKEVGLVCHHDAQHDRHPHLNCIRFEAFHLRNVPVHLR